ncbi:hypothetical protein K9L81_04775 [Candidatus Gracilibacteria bacterium]|nr:hypothetical protein [Candidatus Gracilibacteria bacterium]
MPEKAPKIVAGETTVKTANEGKQPKNIHEKQNNLAKAIELKATEELKDLANHLAVRVIKKGDTLGAIAKGLTGKLSWGMEVDYRSDKLGDKPKPTKLSEAGLIYPGQKVWIENGKIIVADEVVVPQFSAKKEEPKKEEPKKEEPKKEEPKKEEPKKEEPKKEEPKKEEPKKEESEPAPDVSPEDASKIARYNKLVDVVNELAPKVRILARKKGMNVENSGVVWIKGSEISFVNENSSKLENYVKHLGEFQANLTQMPNKESKPDKVPEAGVATGKIETPPVMGKVLSVQGELRGPLVKKSAEKEEIKVSEYDAKQEEAYKKTLLGIIEDQNYDFNGSFKMEKISRKNFVKEVLLKSRTANVKPPQNVADLEAILGVAGAKVDFGIKFFGKTDNSEVLDKVGAWLTNAKNSKNVLEARAKYDKDETEIRVDEVEAKEALATELGQSKELLNALVEKAGELQVRKGSIPSDLAESMKKISDKLTSTEVTLEDAKKMNESMRGYIVGIDKMLQP